MYHHVSSSPSLAASGANTMKRIMPWSIGWLVLALLAGPSQATPPCGRSIQVAYYDLGILYDPATAQGLDRDVVDTLAQRTGCRFMPRFESRVRIWTMLAAGTLDMSVSGIPTPERRQFAEFVPYFWVRNELVTTRRLAQIKPEEFLANPDLRLGVVKSYKHGEAWEPFIEQLRQRGRVDELADTGSLFDQLEANRIAAFPALSLVTLGMAKRYPTRQPMVRLPWFGEQAKIEHGLILSRSRLDPATYKLFQQTISEMRSDGTLKAIFSRYMGNADAEAMLTQ